jgi:hypothetical protein
MARGGGGEGDIGVVVKVVFYGGHGELMYGVNGGEGIGSGSQVVWFKGAVEID